MSINKEDYEEPRCVLCDMNKDKNINPIPISRVLQKEDEYFSKNDYLGAERHLKYWIEEAKAGNDLRGEYECYNELMGLYRKVNREFDAINASNRALDLIKQLGLSGSVTEATTLLNAGTVLKAFGQAKDALPLFIKAKDIYEKKLEKNHYKLAGLYNNMGLMYVDINEFKKAEELYKKALDILTANNVELDKAITYLNICSLIEQRDGLENGDEEISKNIELAWEVFQNPLIERNGYYAFVCDKCNSTFTYYGYFIYGQMLKDEAERIYEGS